MFLNEETEIVAVAMHRVGSQTNPEGGIVECPQLLQVDEVTNEYLKEYFGEFFRHRRNHIYMDLQFCEVQLHHYQDIL